MSPDASTRSSALRLPARALHSRAVYPSHWRQLQRHRGHGQSANPVAGASVRQPGGEYCSARYEAARPHCGPCAKGLRPCIYAPQSTTDAATTSTILTTTSKPATPLVSTPQLGSRSSRGEAQPHYTTAEQHGPLQVLVDACHQKQPMQDEKSPHDGRERIERLERSFLYPDIQQRQQSQYQAAPISPSPIIPSANSPYGYVSSPGTESSASTRVAPLSWFELLATDAANANDRFLLSPPQQFPRTHRDPVDYPEDRDQTGEDPRHSSNLRPRNLRESESFYAAAFRRDAGIEQRLAPQQPTGDGDSVISDGPSSWTTSSPVQLSSLEHSLFTHFVRVSSKWLDFYDPLQHFASVVPHLALRNVGLMKALLALSTRHLSLEMEMREQGAMSASVAPDDTSSTRSHAIDRNLAVQYYYETMHYLNRAMRHPSYARSHEVIATSLLISTYEMIDGSNQDWERHLKGVFWIQRFQDNDGETGGLRSAVWWAWLRQDVWVAMRERRRVFSFWQPKRPLSVLTAPELATRATYLLGQCVNYASKEEQETSDLSRRLERGSELLFLLQEWYDHLPEEYSPLPMASGTTVFPHIWIHPPSYAAALQIHSLARVLVILHRPSSGGLDDYRAAQKLLTLSVNTICGIARTVDESEQAASIVSLHCVFGGKSLDHPDGSLMDGR
ncbi:hypothetical protein PENSUB_8328 [Penicillium subrubescens]|uniref:Transcription factor domain-containing protein n=1 Tax=Penicillium subrubescens TaxID=1316194 RepID=A0A1Q5THK4_9EURO|nr:hypothetical protein PENSUB_8328 [Penicillium subrubescens]